MALDVFVLGLDDVNRATLSTLRDAADYDFHALLSADELRHGDTVPLPELLDEAESRLRSFDGTVEAVVGYWDFPVSLMVPILSERLGLPAPTLTSVLKCEHKYWSRVEQRKVIDELPSFGLIDLDEAEPALPHGLTYPVWVKPVKSAGSVAAYLVRSDAELRDKVGRVRDEAGRMGEPFSFVLSMVDLPAEIRDVGGEACIVEEESHGEQLTVEGYSLDGHVEIYGVVDSIRHEDTASFLRYQYPSALPRQVLADAAEVSRRIIDFIGLDRSTFNIEFFWDGERDRLELLEINPRHSQSHARLFQLVDGLPNHQYMIDLALGRRPEVTHGAGPYEVAAKWFVRHFADGVLRRIPSPAEIAQVEQDVPGTTVVCTVERGDRLSEHHGGDAYSFVLAHLYIGASDEDDLVDKFQRCVDALRFEIDDIGPVDDLGEE